jgi:hypothetical protein
MASRRSSASSSPEDLSNISEDDEQSELANRFSELHVSSGYDVSHSEAKGFFSPLSRSAQRDLKLTARKIRRDLTITEAGRRSEGIIYVAKDMKSSHVKVGFSMKETDARVNDITKSCKIWVEKSYKTSKVISAHRAEQIVHRLLANKAYDRFECECGSDNREWYENSFESTITQVSLVLRGCHKNHTTK